MNTTWGQVESLAANAGAKYPQLVAAQWALESGWGKHVSGKNNFFGIKGPGTVVTTTEFVNGKQITIKDSFKDFASLQECVTYLVSKWYKDYKGYKGVNNSPTVEDAARNLVKQGYATDPKYSEKLITLLRGRSVKPSPATSKMIGPKKTPKDFGFKSGDHHLIVNDITETVKAFAFGGKLLWELPCLARGQGSDFEYKLARTDTPPGLYRVGTVYRDYDVAGANPAYDRTLMAYGWYSFDLEELENQETKFGRAGIMIHGGGSAAGWPGAWKPIQPLFATHGCVRMHNQHLRDKLLPLVKSGKIYVSVYQEG
jgi:lipoprotein-anchoring transpeptidase ErfK/SrfK